MARFQILYWHDIPLQVRAKDAAGRASKPLPRRFQNAADKASMESGLVGTDAYLAQMKWSEPAERDGSAQEVVESLVAELDAKFTEIDWRRSAESLR